MNSNKARLKVGVLFGGRSAEHEVSILSARNILAALDTELFEPIPVAITRDGRWLLQSTERLLREKGDPRDVRIDLSAAEVSLLPHRDAPPWKTKNSDCVENAQTVRSAPRFDVIVPIVHGSTGEDGTLQGVLEMAGVPYVGAGVLGSAVGMDKDVMKRLLQHAGLPVAPFITVRHYDYGRNPAGVLSAIERLTYPLFVKPANLGSSIGINRVECVEQLRNALDLAFSYDTKAIVEESIIGREIECAVLGNDEPLASVPGEIVVNHSDGFYSYDAKYLDDGAQLEIPARLDAEQCRAAQSLAIDTFRVLECSGLARVDFFLTRQGKWFINEINTLPGFTAISMYPKLWAASGVQPKELLTRLIDLALIRHAKRKALRTLPSLRRASSTRLAPVAHAR